MKPMAGKPRRGRPPKGDQARTIDMNVKLSKDDLKVLDLRRGETPRSVYLRDKALAS